MSGITYAPEVVWRFAAQWAGYRQADFLSLPGDEQSTIVAMFEAHNQIEAVLSEAATHKTIN